MNQQEKLRLAHQLDRLGVDVIEAGFPIASDGDFESVQAIAEVVRRPIIAGLARACRPDIERAWEALKQGEFPEFSAQAEKPQPPKVADWQVRLVALVIVLFVLGLIVALALGR
jgi:hypothetical protein